MKLAIGGSLTPRHRSLPFNIATQGIDFGAANSCMAVWRDNEMIIVPYEQGQETTPSMMAFTDAGCLFGKAAKLQQRENVRNTIFDMKLLIGREYDHWAVQKAIKRLPFAVVEQDGRPVVEVEFRRSTQRFTPEAISSMILADMKARAELHFKLPVTEAVITVPVCFNDAQRRATRNAGVDAGFRVLRLLNDTTAASIAHGIGRQAGTLLVIDLGKSKAEVSLLNLTGRVFEVRAAAGGSHLGGTEFDSCLAVYLREELERKYGEQVPRDGPRFWSLWRRCELTSPPICLLISSPTANLTGSTSKL